MVNPASAVDAPIAVLLVVVRLDRAPLTSIVGHTVLSTPRSGTFAGSYPGDTAGIAFVVLVAVVSARWVICHDAGDILFALIEEIYVCLVGGAIGAGVGALVGKGGSRS